MYDQTKCNTISHILRCFYSNLKISKIHKQIQVHNFSYKQFKFKFLKESNRYLNKN